jgi:hypothetical protein
VGTLAWAVSVLYRLDSTLAAVERAVLLVIIGTTGTTHLPLTIGSRAAERGVPLLAINPEPNPFSELALGSGAGALLKGSAGALGARGGASAPRGLWRSGHGLHGPRGLPETRLTRLPVRSLFSEGAVALEPTIECLAVEPEHLRSS